MAMHTVNGWVLSRKPLNEEDQILTLYTHEMGKIRAIAKSVRKISAKLKACASPFTLSLFQLHAKGSAGWFIITGAKVLRQYPQMYADLEKTTDASWICEVLDRLTGWAHPSAEKFALLGDAFDRIATGCDQCQVKVMYGLSLIGYTGHGLELRHCVECLQPLLAEDRHCLCVAGVLCGRCRGAYQGIMMVDQAVYRWLKEFGQGNGALAEYPANKLLFSQLSRFLDFVLRHYIDRPLKTETFRRKIAAFTIV